MYIVKKENIERIAESKAQCDEYIAQGFALVATDTPQYSEVDLSSMTADELKAFAAANSIDLGKSTSVDGILKKLTEGLQEAIGGDENGDDKSGEAKGPARDLDE